MIALMIFSADDISAIKHNSLLHDIQQQLESYIIIIIK